MWAVAGRRARGPLRPLEARWERGEPVSAETLWRLLRDGRSREVPELALVNLGRTDEGRGGVPGLTAIETWADAAVADWSAAGMPAWEGELLRVGPALEWRRDWRRRALVWNDMTAVAISVPRGTRELTVDYRQEPEDRLREQVLVGGARRPVWRSFDWRFFAGANTAVIDGEGPLRRTRRGGWRARIWLGGRLGDAGGLLIGKAHNHLGSLGGSLDRDAAWQPRIQQLEQREPTIAEQFPRLGHAQTIGDTVAVLVHGTRSTCVPMARELQRYLRIPALRFEHDTFRPLVDNADELATLIERQTEWGSLVLIAHSRGGLVARLAEQRLRERGWTGQVEIWTFGTPHLGTPLVGRSLGLVARALGSYAKARMLLKLDTPTDAAGVPVEDPLSAALALLQRRSRIPPGIAEMAVGSPMLRMIALGRTHASVGGACDLASAPVGYGIGPRAAFANRFAREVFGGAPNDLIVAAASSVAAHGGRLLSTHCAHSEYFRHPDVEAALGALRP